MRKPAGALCVCLALSAALLPAAAPAGGRFPAQRGPHSPSGMRPHSGFNDARSFVGPAGHHGRVAPLFPGRFAGKFHHRPLVSWFPSTVFLDASPAVYSTPPAVSSPLVVYSSPTVVYVQPAPAPVAVAPPTPPPMPTVVEYSSGRYELRGDGVTTPHVWVWVPNPPSAAPPPASDGPPAGPASPASPSRIYRWTDVDGTTFWTNRLDTIREPYRSRALQPGSPDRDPS